MWIHFGSSLVCSSKCDKVGVIIVPLVGTLMRKRSSFGKMNQHDLQQVFFIINPRPIS